MEARSFLHQPQVDPRPQGQGPNATKPPPASRLWELLFGWGSREEVKLNNLWVIDYKKASTEETKPLCLGRFMSHANQLFSIPFKRE